MPALTGTPDAFSVYGFQIRPWSALPTQGGPYGKRIPDTRTVYLSEHGNFCCQGANGSVVSGTLGPTMSLRTPETRISENIPMVAIDYRDLERRKETLDFRYQVFSALRFDPRVADVELLHDACWAEEIRAETREMRREIEIAVAVCMFLHANNLAVPVQKIATLPLKDLEKLQRMCQKSEEMMALPEAGQNRAEREDRVSLDSMEIPKEKNFSYYLEKIVDFLSARMLFQKPTEPKILEERDTMEHIPKAFVVLKKHIEKKGLVEPGSFEVENVQKNPLKPRRSG